MLAQITIIALNENAINVNKTHQEIKTLDKTLLKK